MKCFAFKHWVTTYNINSNTQNIIINEWWFILMKNKRNHEKAKNKWMRIRYFSLYLHTRLNSQTGNPPFTIRHSQTETGFRRNISSNHHKRKNIHPIFGSFSAAQSPAVKNLNFKSWMPFNFLTYQTMHSFCETFSHTISLSFKKSENCSVFRVSNFGLENIHLFICIPFDKSFLHLS